MTLRLPIWLSGKESACQGRRRKRRGLDPRVGKIPGGQLGNPLQYSHLENSMDRGGWRAVVHGVAKSWTRLSTHTQVDTNINFKEEETEAETLRLSWNILLGSVITGWWSGNGLGKYRSQETNQTQRQRALAGAPKRGIHRQSRAPGGLVKGSTIPAAPQAVPSTRQRARSLLAHNKAKKGQCGRGERGPANGGLTFPRGTKAAASRT